VRYQAALRPDIQISYIESKALLIRFPVRIGAPK
jgi:hypothetical protein